METGSSSKKNFSFNYDDPRENWMNDSMYITEYYPESFYSDYNPGVWELFGVEGRYSKNECGLPLDCCKEIRDYYGSFGDEAFQVHCISGVNFLSNVETHGAGNSVATSLAKKLLELGNPDDMRFILWFSQ
ncbi:MAG TPA: hypothetical protein ENJ08_06800 [Gammaproteobacteria bacterium]|nr:hypothetical protein [Gammaproteobacteria bacterium]